jgi:hypothetical protein
MAAPPSATHPSLGRLCPPHLVAVAACSWDRAPCLQGEVSPPRDWNRKPDHVEEQVVRLHAEHPLLGIGELGRLAVRVIGFSAVRETFRRILILRRDLLVALDDQRRKRPRRIHVGEPQHLWRLRAPFECAACAARPLGRVASVSASGPASPAPAPAAGSCRGSARAREGAPATSHRSRPTCDRVHSARAVHWRAGSRTNPRVRATPASNTRRWLPSRRAYILRRSGTLQAPTVRERPYFAARRLRRAADTRHHRFFVHLQARVPWVQDLHVSSRAPLPDSPKSPVSTAGGWVDVSAGVSLIIAVGVDGKVYQWAITAAPAGPMAGVP